jgi:hypothetical protein
MTAPVRPSARPRPAIRLAVGGEHGTVGELVRGGGEQSREQTDQALCLTVVTDAVVLFNTVYLQHALDALRQRGHNVDGHAAVHLSPALHEHINPYGSYSFDIERELGRTDLRPLRDPT